MLARRKFVWKMFLFLDLSAHDSEKDFSLSLHTTVSVCLKFQMGMLLPQMNSGAWKHFNFLQ